MTKRAMTWRGASWRRGVLALGVLAMGASTHVQPGPWAVSPWASPAGVALAEELDCIDDKDNYDAPECVELREAAQREAEKAQQLRDAADAAAANEQASQPVAAPGPSNDPNDMVLTLADAGKEATQYISEDGTDKHGRWARRRYERDRGNSASTLGPNVLDSKAWVTKDADAAKALFKEQADLKQIPERKEGVTGPNTDAKLAKRGDDYSVLTQYYQDDSKIWHHYRIVMRKGSRVVVLYMFGREEFFFDVKKKEWNGQGDWFIERLAERI